MIPVSNEAREAADAIYNRIAGRHDHYRDWLRCKIAAFQAQVEKATLERAAEAVEAERLHDPQDETDAAYDRALDHALAAIRALGETE